MAIPSKSTDLRGRRHAMEIDIRVMSTGTGIAAGDLLMLEEDAAQLAENLEGNLNAEQYTRWLDRLEAMDQGERVAQVRGALQDSKRFTVVHPGLPRRV